MLPAWRRRALRKRRRLLLAVALSAALVLTLLIGLLAVRINGVVVLAVREMPSVPVYYYQEDPAWSAATLGDSDRTLGKSGDSVACLASLLAMQGLSAPGLDATDPGALNDWLSENGAYDARGALQWRKVAALLGAKAVEKPAQRGLGRLLERLLQREIYPVVTVRRPDTGASHDVLVVGSVHGEYVIVDPLDPTGVPNTLGLYGNRIYGMRYFE